MVGKGGGECVGGEKGVHSLVGLKRWGGGENMGGEEKA